MKLSDADYEFMLTDRIAKIQRTGCKGCPYTKDIQEQLDTMYKLLPNEYKQCLHLWKPVYDEYIRIGYRLTQYPHEKGVQYTLDDYLKY